MQCIVKIQAGIFVRVVVLNRRLASIAIVLVCSCQVIHECCSYLIFLQYSHVRDTVSLKTYIIVL